MFGHRRPSTNNRNYTNIAAFFVIIFSLNGGVFGVLFVGLRLHPLEGKGLPRSHCKPFQQHSSNMRLMLALKTTADVTTVDGGNIAAALR
ncbi:MAG: hypothetical protein F9K32_20510 [Desulfobulbaceae bacterium]|nr:MAG: hypothetical protein F9K32_20510 [Desulfobulbaceae bacterium]